MDIKLPKEVENILNKFSSSGYRIYIVGGAVRDLISGKKVTDWDFATDATPEQILKVLPEGFYDNKFGTVGIPISHLGGVTPVVFEITTMRKEGVYEDTRHPSKVYWTNKIEEDLSRRDFTINAIALSDKGEIIDPFKGVNDLHSKLIKAVGNPDLRFKEDALRLIRAIRFSAQLGFEIESETFNSIIRNNDLIQKIAWERIRDEFFKILVSSYPYEGTLKLRESGILKIILPELERCFGIKQEGPKHNRTYDIGEHLLLSLKMCSSPDPVVRLAALIHDIGKPDTMHIQQDGNVTFYSHDIVGEKLVRAVAQRLRLSKKDAEKSAKLVRWHMFTVDIGQTDSAIRRFIKNVGMENIEGMMALRIADRLGGGTQRETSWRMEKFKQRIKEVLKKPFTISDLKVNGNDVMEILNLKPGPKVGEVLEKLFKEVSEDAGKNNRDYLLSKIRELKIEN